MDIYKDYDLEERKFPIENSSFPWNFEGLCTTAIEPLYFSPRETIPNRGIHVTAA